MSLRQRWAAGESSNKDRPTTWITFHFEPEHDAVAAHKLLEDVLNKAVKVEWP